VSVDLSDDDLALIINALNTICNGGHPIPEWEFHALIGFERDEAQALLKRLTMKLPGASP
jgi:hypothetical protein